jgi:hypothetical protein
MAVTLTAEVQVDTKDLRNALRAVTPHAEPNKTGDLDDEHRVRLLIDEYHVHVLASNGSTAAMAIVSIEEDTRRKGLDPDDGPLIVDLTPRQARLILQQFKAKKTDPEGVEQIAALRVLTDGEGLEVADVSGLFAGESVRFPGVGVSDRFPDVLGVITRALAAASGLPSPKPLTADGATVALFKAASVVYEQPLTVEATGTPESRGFLVSCGESFLGVISSRHQDDDSLRKRDGWRHGWIRRLGLADPVREAERQLTSV